MNNIIDKIQLSGVTYDIGGQGGSGVSVVEVTQQQYDELPSSAKTDTSKMYVITDAQAGDLTQYWTSAQTQSAITEATSGKVDSSSVVSSVTSASTDSEIPTAKAVWDVASQGGGGKAVSGGTNISITTGETADTINCILPISAGTGENSIIIGDGRNISSGIVSVAEGFQTSAMTSYAHSEGSRTLASGGFSTHAEGSRTSATSDASHSEGYQTSASGNYSHSEGNGTLASGQSSHSEGYQTSASGNYSHSEGSRTLASGQSSHSEGYQTSATSMYSHSEGWGTTANGKFSHSEGSGTTASGEGSHTEGKGTIALNKYEHSEGYFNVSSSSSSTFGDSGNTLFSVGNGTADNARHNAFEIRQNGDIYLSSGGTDIKLQDHLGGGGGGGCTVDTTVIYDTLTTDLFDYQGVYKYEYTIVDYQGDKSSDTKGLFFIIGDASNDYAQGYINLDYPNHSASTENTALTEYTSVEYISDIEDFKISVASAYQSTCWIKSIQNLYQTEIKVEYYKINSGSPCTAIETDVVGLIEKVKDTVDNSVKNASLSSQKDKLEFSYNPNKGYSVSFPVKLEELDGTDSILKPDIKVPLGVSGWTDFSLSDSCNVNNINGTKIRVTYDYETFNADSMSLTIVADVDRYEHYDNLYFDWNTQQPIYDGYFTGVTVSWSDTTKELVVEYPATIEESEEIKNVKISRLNSSYCQFGYSIIKVEAYGELTQGLKPYVQQLRSDVNTISGEVQSKVSTSAVTSAVTSSSTDDEIPTAKAVYDSIPTATSAVTSGSTDVLTSGGAYEQFGGLKIVKLTESEYAALVTKDESTLYVVIPDPNP